MAEQEQDNCKVCHSEIVRKADGSWKHKNWPHLDDNHKAVPTIY